MGKKVSFTVGRRGGNFGGAFPGGGAGGRPFSFASLMRFCRGEFGSGYFPTYVIVAEFMARGEFLSSFYHVFDSWVIGRVFSFLLEF